MSSNAFYLKKQTLVAILILIATLVIYFIVTGNPPKAKRGRPSVAPQISVDVITLNRKDFPIVIDSYGTIEPRTQSILLPQVSGQIIEISDNFRAGAFFEKGEVLIKLDDRDLKAEVKIAQANLFNAKQGLSEEQARVEQAKLDWQRLGNSDVPPDLVLRKPQLMAAQAKLYSAQASLEKAKLAVERSQIKAPYTGRILTKLVDLGQVISPSTRLAEIYAVDYVEIRLPLKNKDLPYMDFPESSRLTTIDSAHQPEVTIYSNLVKQQTWQGKVVRTEGAFDKNSQQLFVVAQINDPYGESTERGLPLKIGQYVSAKITGRVASQVLTVPNKAIYQGSYVYVVENGLLKRININIAWQNQDIAIIDSGVEQGQMLVLTPLGQVTSGTPVNIKSVDGQAVKMPNNGGAERKNHQGKRYDKAQKPLADAKTVAEKGEH